MDQMVNPPKTVGQLKRAGLLGETQNKAVEQELRDAMARLQEYKTGKHMFEARIIANNNWWRLRNGEVLTDKGKAPARTSAWLLNALMGKHADMVEAYPRPNILPREESDKAEADILSSIVPVILERNHFGETYSGCMWDKVKSGTAVYGIFWDAELLNGMGDIAITRINPLNLYWEPGVEDIEDSKEVFYVSMVDNDALELQYPQLRDKLRGSAFTPAKNRTDDHVDEAKKSAVVDWYKKEIQGTKTVLRYIKFCAETILYDSASSGSGHYDDGAYPFVFDILLPAEGTPAGYGYIDIAKDTQADIDLLDDAMVRNARISAAPRYFVNSSSGINEEEYTDVDKELIHVAGDISDRMIRKFDIPTIPGSAMQMLDNKIEELKQITSNQDVVSGGGGGGVTAASAIAALQESAGRTSRDAIKGSYRAYSKVVTKVIERIRQFYDLPRQFRIVGQYGAEKFVTYSNQGLKPAPMMGMDGTELGYRLPVFDISVVPEKESAYSRISRNELAKELFAMGAFNPQLADQMLLLLEFMDFDGKDKLMRKIQEQAMMQQQLILYQQMALSLAQKYEPQLAEGLGQSIMQQAGLPMPTGAPATNNSRPADGNPAEASHVVKAREQAQQATQPA